MICKFIRDETCKDQWNVLIKIVFLSCLLALRWCLSLLFSRLNNHNSLSLSLLDYYVTFAKAQNKVQLQKKFESFNYSVETSEAKEMAQEM